MCHDAALKGIDIGLYDEEQAAEQSQWLFKRDERSAPVFLFWFLFLAFFCFCRCKNAELVLCDGAADTDTPVLGGSAPRGFYGSALWRKQKTGVAV